MTPKGFLLLSGMLLCALFFEGYAFCSEVYSIDHQPVLFYKTINWWYDCPPGECDWFCGKSVTYTNGGNARIRYNEAKKTLRLKIEGGFADLLSIFKTCEQCFGSSYLQCTWQDEKYFGKSKAAIVSDLNGFSFAPIDRKQARILESTRQDILFVVEGRIGGLQNDGKIALHQAGNLLIKCSNVSEDQAAGYPITLKIVNARTNEAIATFLASYKN